MQANTGSGLYIRKGHTDAFKTTETITASTNTTWMPVTGYSGSALTTATTFNGSFGVLSDISSSALTYTAVTGTVEGSTDAYTATVNGSETNGIYYHFELDYMITAGKSLKVTATEVTPSVTTATPNIAQATRVGIIEAESVTMTENQMTGADFTGKTGKEYLVAAPAGDDYNLEELKALGYTGTTEYKTGLTRLDEAGATITNSTALATTSDGAFAYGSLSIYVWFDGTDYSCTNAIFSQTLDLTLTFAVAE